MNDDLMKKKSDYLLELALEEQLESDEEMNAYKLDAESIHTFSDEHNHRVDEIQKRAEKRNLFPKIFPKKRLQAVVCLCFALTISVFAVTRVEAFRLPIIQFFTEVKEKSTKFIFQGENNTNLTKNYQAYEPGYIPDGYNIVEVNEGDGTFYMKFVDDEETKSYTFWYYDTPSASAFDTEEAGVTEILISGNESYAIEKNNELRILMNKDNHQFFLRGTLSLDEACKIMESIK
ncbi:DUF4367 domain-containing protein [Clostridium transplantifaecale]|uniref:DUF4367 domain-containing protein n=1 Tax=Clostridium transplantifaecale TaxID=2479838 RepID=UPI000F63C379|nr:DUF4367 domain-containing protein [Clostridium transplantifaecale]